MKLIFGFLYFRKRFYNKMFMGYIVYLKYFYEYEICIL